MDPFSTHCTLLWGTKLSVLLTPPPRAEEADFVAKDQTGRADRAEREAERLGLVGGLYALLILLGGGGG